MSGSNGEGGGGDEDKPPEQPPQPHSRRHSQGELGDSAHMMSGAAMDYPDEFFEARDDSVLILRHPYYNEVTEDLGATAETLLEDQQAVYSDAMDGGGAGGNEDIPDLLIPDTPSPPPPGTPILTDKTIPLVNVEISQNTIELKQSESSNIEQHQQQHQYQPSEETVLEEDTCHINYGLLKRYLETIHPQHQSQSLLEQPGDRFAFYSAKTGFVRAATLWDISPHLIQVMQSGVFWLDICAPSPLELKVFGEVFKMHPLTLEDIQLDDVREKCDVFEDYFIVCLKAFEHATGRLDYSQPINLYVLCAGKACVVSIHHHPLHFSQTIAKRIRLLSARTGLSTDWIAYGILDDVIDSFSPAIYECECDVEAIEDACMQPGVARPPTAPTGSPQDAEPEYENSSMFHRITACRKSLTLLTRLVTSKNEAVRNVLKRCASRLSEDALVYLRDLQDHVHMMEQSLEHCDDALNRAYSNYLAHISIETSHTSNRMSRVMKTLSAFAAVTTPCTVVSCLLGMNLRGPFWPYGADRNEPGSGSGGPYDFILVVSFILAATVLLVYVGKRNDWF